MRRVLGGVLILLFASFAQAGLIFTLNGEPQPDSVYLRPSEIIELDLELGEGQNILAFTLDYILSNDQARFITDGASGSYPDLPPMTDIEILWQPWLGEVLINEPQHVRITSGQLFNPLEGPVVLMKELYVHCLDTTDVILDIVVGGTTIVDGETIPTGTLLHTLTIHQIPEPMTIALLGLGGLFALRRKKE